MLDLKESLGPSGLVKSMDAWGKDVVGVCCPREIPSLKICKIFVMGEANNYGRRVEVLLVEVNAKRILM